MDFSLDAVVTAIEQFATPAPELIEGLLEAPRSSSSYYEGYPEGGPPMEPTSGVNLDSAESSPATADPLALPGRDLAISIDAVSAPDQLSTVPPQSALLASAASTRYLHELGAAEVDGNISLSMAPASAVSLNTEPLVWQGQTGSSGIGL